VDFSWNIADGNLGRILHRLPESFGGKFERLFKRILTQYRTYHREHRMRGRPGVTRRTGDLIKSFALGSTRAGGTGVGAVEAWLASRSAYAGIQETGGRVKPRRRKYLAIPLKAAQTKARDVSGKFIGTIAGQTQPSLYGVKGLFVIKSKKGNLLLVKRKSKKGGIIPLFVLKKSVKIPARLAFRATFKQFMRGSWTRGELKRIVSAAWKAVGGK